VKITDKLDLHATLDYQDWQQGIEVGLGFRF
ncbi:ribonuclease regulator, partial [Vibrio antiquarius]